MRSVWTAAAAITFGFIAAEYIPGEFAALYTDKLGPLFGGLWLSYVFNRWWKGSQARILAMPPSALKAMLFAGVALLLLGGIRLLWVDPWLFAPMLWPLVEVARTLWQLDARGRRRGTRPGSAPPGQHAPID